MAKLEEVQIVFTQVQGPEDLKQITQMLRDSLFPLSEWFTPLCEGVVDDMDGPYRATIKFVRRSHG